MTLRIKNWKKYQHYTKRNPPWIKLHFSILSSEDWVTLDDASKLLAVVSMLVASKHDGEIPASASPDYFKRLAYLDRTPNFKPLIDCGFLIDTLADDSKCERLQANARPETETETETEKKDIAPSARVKIDYSESFIEFYFAYPKRKSKKDAEKAYKAARKDVSHETIMDGLRRAVASDPRFRDPQFTPYPASWLRAGGYEDQANVVPLKLEAWS